MVPLAARAAHAPVFAPRRAAPARALVVGVAVAVAVAFGVWLRLWLLAHAPLNSDEAVVGLMADAILHGHRSAFYWGQSYGGAEPYVVAAMFALFGHSAYVLTLTASVLAALAAVVVWVLGRRVLERRGAAAVAAALTWAWPWAQVRNSTMELGFRQVTLVCGLAAVTLAHRAAYGPRPGAAPYGRRPATIERAPVGGWPTWAALGLVAGVGWWSSPEIVYFAVAVLPLVAVGVARSTAARRAGGLVAVVAGFGAGAAPWLVANASSGFASLRSGSVGGVAHGSYLHRLSIFVTHMGPLMLGLRQPTIGAWTVSEGFAVALCAAVAVLALAGAAVLWIRGPRGAWAIGLYVVAFPFVYAALPPTSYWQDGRYGVFWPPMVALVVVGGAAVGLEGARVPWARVAGAVAVLALAATSTLYGFDRAFPPAGRPGGLAASADDTATDVGRDLVRHHLTSVIGSYWTAYDLDFLTPALTATPIAPVRDGHDYEAVMAATPVAWLFIGPSSADRRAADATWGNLSNPLTLTLRRFTTDLKDLRIGFRVVDAGFMVAVVPTHQSGAAITARFT